MDQASSPASRPKPETAPTLRESVLDGRFFGARYGSVAENLAELVAAPLDEAAWRWFGTGQAATLLRSGPDALRTALDRDIASLDQAIGAQLDAVLHHSRLRRLEGTWRGLAWLVRGVPAGARVKLRLLNAAWPELCRDLERAVEFDQSNLFRKVYEDEFGTPGGEPFGLLVVDHEVRHRPGPGSPTDDVTALGALAGVAAAAFAPVVLGASPALLQVDAFADLAAVADLGSPFRGPDHARWRSLAGQEDIRFVAIALPRLLARAPWGDDPGRADGFRYAEYAPDADCRVWMGAGFAFAAAAARAFAQYGWPADVRGCETDQLGGGLVIDLAAEPFGTDMHDAWVRQPLEVVLTDRQERALVDAGLMPVSGLPFGPDAVFGAARSLQSARQYQGPNAEAANANARLSAQLNSMLCTSRFAHYVKLLGRGMVGSFRTAEEIERQLQEWLTGYVNANLAGGPEARARYPLVNGRVTIHERPGRPGVFGCTMLLQPHFQLDNVSATFRLVTDITAPGLRPAA